MCFPAVFERFDPSLKSEKVIELVELFTNLGSFALEAQVIRLEQAAPIVPVKLISKTLAKHISVFL